jgi:hypothetical protein
MKSGMKLFTMIGTVFAAGVLAASPLVASAEGTVDLDTAVYVGQTPPGGLTPVLLVGGGGSYTFNSIACAGASVDLDGAVPDPTAVGLCSITSTGTYTNTVCGTGTVNAGSTASITEADETYNASITITFVAGVGVVQGSVGADPVVGVAVLLPTSPATPPACVTGFTVVGAAATTA